MAKIDWHTPVEQSHEDDQQTLANPNMPEWMKAPARERLTMDPDTRQAEYKARQAEADVKQVVEVNEFTREMTKQEELKLKQEQERTKREEVKQRRADQPIATADPNSISLEFATMADTATVSINYLLDPYLPEKCVVGFYGRGSTSKSSFVASMAAHISGESATLWVSVEEPADWIKVRHIKAGGADNTLQVVKAVAIKKDGHGRTVGSTFNVFEHLEPAIIAAKVKLLNVQGAKPLKLVVLDTAVGLTTWTASAGPNSDEGVKRLLAYLQGLAEAHALTIAIIGHANKGKHEHFADVVMGASAWTNSPRLSFVHAADRREEYAYVIRVAKTNLVTFGSSYTTVPVHTLYSREDGPDSVLVKVVPGTIVWGEMDSMDLWEAATTIANDDEGERDFGSRKLTVADIVRNKLIEMVHAGQDPFITREQVECQLRDVKINRGQWAKVDLELRQGQFVHGVEVTTGPQNMSLYRKVAGG